MKKVLTILITLFCISSLATANPDKPKDEKQEAGSAFGRYMESAHPTPMKAPKVPSMLPLAETSKSALFLNASTTVDDDALGNRVQNESSIAVNPTNPLNLIASAVDYRDNSATWVYVSHDGGKTWENINLGHVFGTWISSNDPSVAFSNEGVGYLVHGGFGTMSSGGVLMGENGVFFARSFDEGRTWEQHIPVILHRGTMTLDSSFEDKYYITVDNSPSSPHYSDLYIPWKRMSPRDSATQIVMSKSVDGGDTWTVPVGVSDRLTGTTEDTTYGQSWPLAACGPNGEVYVVWNHGIEHGVGFAKSMDGGETFSDAKIVHHYEIFGETRNLPGQGWRHSVKGKVRAEAYPAMVTDVTGGPNNGAIYLIWAADRVPNIYFSKSMDQGETWTDPITVHSDNTNDQFWPWLAIDPLNGDLAIMYLDSRRDPDNIMVECWVSYSSDGGDTWIDRPAADVSGDLRLNPFTGNAFAGDYSGCAFYDGIIYPSWIDMRNAVSDVFDSDVYTAIVNTRAPLPVQNFEASVFAADPTSLELSWEEPTETSFGAPIGEFHYSLWRDDEYFMQLPSGTNSYTDSGLEPFKRYDYKIRVIGTSDSSMAKEDFSYAGGAKEPRFPDIEYVKGEADNNTTIYVKMPAVRADMETPLAALKRFAVFSDGELLGSEEVSPTDTGKVVNFAYQFSAPGFYMFTATVSDDFGSGIDPQTSERSYPVLGFTGPVNDELSENFDNLPLNKYFNSGRWATTSTFYKSAPNCITESPDGNYEDGKADTLMLFPVQAAVGKEIILSFWHAAIVEKGDDAMVEYSTDRENWNELGKYLITDFDPWDDGELNADDWKHEEISIGRFEQTDSIFVRFRFQSSVFRNNDGWYIDDISISGITDVDDNFSNETTIKVFPNPAVNALNIETSNPAAFYGDMKIIDIYGSDVSLLVPIESLNSGSLRLDISHLAPGAYYIAANGIRGRFTIVR